MNDKIPLSDLPFFSTLVKCGSLSAAGRDMGVSTAAISQRLAQLEKRIGVSLINRTTRKMGITPEGEILYEYASRISSEMNELNQLLSSSQSQPKGLLRINATLGFGRMHIAPLIASFIRKYPAMDIQLQLTTSVPPLADDSFDVSIHFGEPSDSRIIARKLIDNQRILCASKQYLSAHGVPREPRDLVNHSCISIRQFDDIYGIWRLSCGEGAARQTESIKIRNHLSTNDGEIAVNWALEGLGILMRSKWDIGRYLDSGRLIQVLSEYQTPDANIYAIYPQHLHSCARVKIFVDFLAKSLRY